ncbi:MAG TPA: RNA pseudouridine synthase [Bacteroidetes bacterium]|nr:RNA pseudouridine synthase [Bacteroidota bacterium]
MIENEEITEENEDELYEHYRFVVDKGQEPLRIDKFLFNRIEKISRSRIQKGIEDGGVLVNGTEIASNYKVKPKDIITIMLPEPKSEYDVLPENIPLNIVNEDAQLAIINKQAGMVVHPGVGNWSGTLVNALLFHFNQLPSVKGNEIRPGLVHRIDKDTTGLVVVAKDEYSLNFLAKQFAAHTIDRKYIALVWGDVKNDEGTIVGHIGRNLKDRKKMDIFPEGNHGKEAVTHYKVIERFHYVTLIECKLETGRTHQIRVHMKSIGHPLFNDETYGGNKILKGTVYAKYRQFVENCFELCKRQALHAASLGFIHPKSGKHVYFESELPDDMKQVIEKWRSYYASVISR